MLGEPSEVEAPKKPESRGNDGPRLPSFDGFEGFGGIKQSLPTVSSRSLLIGLGVIVVAGAAFMFMSRTPESLADTATSTAERFAADDLAYLKQMATSDTIDDVVRWFDAVHPALVKSREQWKTSGTRVQVMVVDEDARQRRGEAHAYIYPSAGTSHGTSISEAANASTSGVDSQPIDLKLRWVLDGGQGKLDGRETFMAIEKPL